MTNDAPLNDEWAIRLRCRAARMSNGLSVAKCAERAGQATSTITFLESGGRRNVYLDVVWGVAKACRVHPRHLIGGWRAWDKTVEAARRLTIALEVEAAKPPTLRGAMPDLEAADLNTRRMIRQLRGVRGTPQVARDAWGKASQQSTLVRWESGEYRRIDLVRLSQLAKYFGVTTNDLVFSPATGE